MSRLLRYNATVKRTVTCFDLATIASTSMLVFVCRIRRPIAKRVLTCFRNRFCFCSSANRTSISLYTFLKVSRFSCYNAIVKRTVAGFDLATIASTSMLIFVCRIRRPIAKSVLTCRRNGFCFCSSAYLAGIRFDTLFKMSGFFCYNATVKRTVTCFDLATITSTSMLVFVCRIWCPTAKCVLTCFFNGFRFGSSTNLAGIRFDTLLKVSRFFCYNTTVKRTVTCFDLATITSTSMLIFGCRIRCPIAKSVLTCRRNGFCFCPSANRASISLYTFLKMSRFLRHLACIKGASAGFGFATLTFADVHIFVCCIRCRIGGPIAKYVLTCFRNRFCFCSSANRAGISLYTFLKMSRLLRHLACIKGASAGFNFATLTFADMHIFGCRNRRPIAKCVLTCFRNRFCFCSSAYLAGIRFDTLFKMSRILRYNTTVKRTVTCFDLATITPTSMLVFVTSILRPPAESMYVLGRSHFRDYKVGKTACFK